MQRYNKLTLQLTITHNGIKYAKRNYQDIEKAQYNITIMGDIAGRDRNKIHNTGDNTTNIINTGTQTIEDAFNELKEAITKEYTGTDKAAVLQEVDALRKEARNDNDKETVIKRILGIRAAICFKPCHSQYHYH